MLNQLDRTGIGTLSFTEFSSGINAIFSQKYNGKRSTAGECDIHLVYLGKESVV